MDPTRKGKIARLPHALREEVCLRLLDGQGAGTILPWLNARPDAARTWAEWFDGEPCTAQNLSAWRLGGYRDWLRRRQKVEHLKTLQGFAVDLAKSGGRIADGAAAIISGHILEALEDAANLAVTRAAGDPGKDPAAGLAKMASAIASLQGAGVQRAKLELDKRTADRKDDELALQRDKFQAATVKAFLKWARSDEARAILDSGKPAAVQMDLLRELMFGPVAGK